MPTPASHTLDELENALGAAVSQMRRLSDENVTLRGELAEAKERMRAAGNKLRVVADRLPQAAASETRGAEVTQEKAA